MSAVFYIDENAEMKANDQSGLLGLIDHTHSRIYMPSVPPFWTQSRTNVRSIVHPSSTSTSRFRSISKLAGVSKDAESLINEF